MFLGFSLVLRSLFSFLAPISVNRILSYIETQGEGAVVRPWYASDFSFRTKPGLIAHVHMKGVDCHILCFSCHCCNSLPELRLGLCARVSLCTDVLWSDISLARRVAPGYKAKQYSLSFYSSTRSVSETKPLQLQMT